MNAVLDPAGLSFRHDPPNPIDFIRLRVECGWGQIEASAAQEALSSSLIHITCYFKDELVGMGRVIGDGALNFYLQDIIVRPAFQGHCIGKTLVSMLLDETKKRAGKGATIGLMSARGKENFYSDFGFQVRPSGKIRFWNDYFCFLTLLCCSEKVLG